MSLPCRRARSHAARHAAAAIWRACAVRDARQQGRARALCRYAVYRFFFFSRTDAITIFVIISLAIATFSRYYAIFDVVSLTTCYALILCHFDDIVSSMPRCFVAAYAILRLRYAAAAMLMFIS